MASGACSGSCAAGYVCSLGSTSPKQANCSADGSKYCPAVRAAGLQRPPLLELWWLTRWRSYHSSGIGMGQDSATGVVCRVVNWCQRVDKRRQPSKVPCWLILCQRTPVPVPSGQVRRRGRFYKSRLPGPMHGGECATTTSALQRLACYRRYSHGRCFCVMPGVLLPSFLDQIDAARVWRTTAVRERNWLRLLACVVRRWLRAAVPCASRLLHSRRRGATASNATGGVPCRVLLL